MNLLMGRLGFNPGAYTPGVAIYIREGLSLERIVYPDWSHRSRLLRIRSRARAHLACGPGVGRAALYALKACWGERLSGTSGLGLQAVDGFHPVADGDLDVGEAGGDPPQVAGVQGDRRAAAQVLGVGEQVAVLGVALEVAARTSSGRVSAGSACGCGAK